MAGNAVARRLSERLLGASKKTSVVDRYWSDPAAYAKEKLGASPSPYQAEILTELHRRRRVAVRGPHGLGKTAMAAWAALAFAETREAAGKDWKVVTTAGGWRQLTKYLWPETTKWARRLGTYAPGKELLTMGLKLDHGEAFAVASNKPELIEGAHADEILYIVDEGKAVAESTWDAIEGAFSAGEAYVLALSTPGSALGRFHAIHARKPGLEDWWPRHVTLEEAITAGRVTREWAERRRRQWGEGSPVYRTRVLGEFAEDQDGIIPLAWIEAAIERWREWAEAGRAGERVQTCIGVDVGGGDPGGDRTTIARRSGQVITRLEVYSRGDTMATAGRAVVALRAGGYAHVDSIGVGAGVVARLRELDLELDVRTFVAGGRPYGSDVSGELEFANRRAEAWWGMRERLDPARGSSVCLPPDDEIQCGEDEQASLIGELTAPRMRTTSAGKLVVEEKAEIRKRIGRSTDVADAVIQAFAPVDPSSGPVDEADILIGESELGDAPSLDWED